MPAVAARQSRQSAGTLAAIEQERFRRELAPVFRIRCEVGYPMPRLAVLFILLTGGPLDDLERVQVTIVDSANIVPESLPAGVSEAEARRWLWTGWQFNTFYTVPGAMAASPRQSYPRRFSLG